MRDRSRTMTVRSVRSIRKLRRPTDRGIDVVGTYRHTHTHIYKILYIYICRNDGYAYTEARVSQVFC